MLIAHITDSHIEIPEPEEAGRIADFERVIADISNLSQQPDLVIHTGDVTHCDRKEEYQKARRFMQLLAMPSYVIPGNKDQRGRMADVFGLMPGFIQQVVDTPDWQFLLLDTLSDTSNKGAYCEQRLQWLEAQLCNASKPVAIFMHHPSFDMADNPYPFQFEHRSVAQEFDKMVARFDVVKGIFCGHAHRNTTGKVGNIPGMTLTAMSLDRRKGTYTDEMAGNPVYQLIEFSPNGSFSRQLRVAV